MTTVYLDSVTVRADVDELRQLYERELREDGLYDANAEKIIAHVYEQNADALGLEVESVWLD